MTGWTICLLFLAALVFCAVCDARTREVPLLIQGAAFVRILAWCAASGRLIPNVFAGAVIFGILCIGAWLFGLGGADAIAGGLIGLALGMYGIFAVTLALLLTLPYLAHEYREGDRNPDYPFFPYLVGGYAAALALMAAAA